MTRMRSRIVEISSDPRALYEMSLAEGWGDGAPLLPPTDEAIAALLAAAPHGADHVIGSLPPKFAVATLEYVAINAAMAGCAPAAFPFVVAALEGIIHPEFNAFGVTGTTSSAFPILIANGPSRDALGIDYRAGCLGGAAGRGSMTIGRAVALCLRNIGGQRVGDTSRSVFGQPARLGFCFGEWEERSPWPSLAERRGFRNDQDVVTVHTSKGPFPLADIYNDDAKDLAYLIAKCMAYPLSNWFLEVVGDTGQVVLLVNPLWAERFGEAFPRIEEFQAWLWEHSWQPIDLWPPSNQAILRKNGRVDAQGRVHLNRRPEQFVPVVCGGLGNLHAIVLTTWCQTEMQSVAVQRP